MQSKTFTFNLDQNITQEVLVNSGLEFTLDGANYLHSNIDITTSNVSMISNSTAPIVPFTVEVVFPVSYTITIQVSHPTSLDIDDLTLTYVASSWKEYDRDEVVAMQKRYQPLNNFYDGSGNLWNDINYNSPFRSENLNLNFNSQLDTELQFSYDGSVNILFTDDVNPIRLVNSRWALSEDGQNARIGERRQIKDTNTYSDEYFHRTELIPSFKNVSNVNFVGLLEAGKLLYGGYRYFFRYLTADGAESNIIEESRLIEVHKGNSVLTARGGAWDKRDSGMSVKLELQNLDSSYYAIRVYYTHATGGTGSISTAHKLLASYVIEGEKCVILHTGYEPVENIDRDTLNVSYSLLSTAKTIASANNRLLLSNVELVDLYSSSLADSAGSVKIYEEKFDVVHSSDMLEDSDENYANPIFTYEKLGYWRGETYEVGIVFTSDESLSPVYPIRGLDNLNGNAVYNPMLAGNTGPGFYDNGENSLGVYRTEESMESFFLYNSNTSEITFKGTSLKVNIKTLLGFTSTQTSYMSTTDTFYIIHDTSDDSYHLNGVLSTAYSSGATVAIDAGLPIPTGDVVFTYINSDDTSGQCTLLDGTATVRFDIDSSKGTNFDKQSDIQPTLADNYTGFFFVRRVRKQDKLAQGVLTPTAAIPTISSVLPDTSTYNYGNFTGIGVESEEYGKNVTYIPAPTCSTPWGAENMYPIQYELGEKTLSDNNFSTDFIQRAPILTYDEQAAWAFYSPDIDTNPVHFATKFNGGKFGISVNTFGIPATFIFMDEPPILNEKLPTRVEINNAYDHAEVTPQVIRRYVMEATYAESGSFNPSIEGFSAKHDRNLCIYTNTSIENYNKLTFGWKGGANYPIGIGMEGDSLESKDNYGPKLDSMMNESRSPSTSVNYGRYLGIKINTYSGGLEDLNMPQDRDGEMYEWTNVNWQSSLITRFVDQEIDRRFIADDGTPYGMIANVYESTSARSMTNSEWISRYEGDEDSSYYAITERYSAENFTFNDQTINLYGGDCYLGLQWKQVWSPAGIPGSISTNDLDPYRADRTALGLLNYGFAIPVPVQANNNFHIRKEERSDENEYRIYGKDRTYLPGKIDIRGDRLMETGLYDFGYTNLNSDRRYARLNVNTPFIKVSYPNRVYNSDVAETNQLWNGFTIFKGLNFKDYNRELGAITKVITVNNYTYLIFHHGIAQVGVNERSMISGDTGGVFTDSYDVLSSKSNVVTKDYGSQHIFSVIASSNYLYGVDVINKKIWRTGAKGATLLSDFKIQLLLTTIIDDLQNQAILDGGVFDVFSTYDLIKGEIFFTFSVRTADDLDIMYSRTIVYNELLGIWVTETDDTRKFFFKSDEDRYSLPSLEDWGILHKYYRYETNLLESYYNKFYGTLYDAKVGFNVLDNPMEAKILENIFVVGNNNIPYGANYTIDNLPVEKTQLFVPSTNVAYLQPTYTVTGVSGSDQLLLSPGSAPIKWNGEPLGKNDFISIPDEGGTVYYFTCMGIIGSTMYIDKFLPSDFITQPLTIGYKNPIRLATSIYEDDFTKLVCKIREPGDTSKLYIPRGKWFQVRLDYDGMAPMYIERIMSSFSVSYS